MVLSLVAITEIAQLLQKVSVSLPRVLQAEERRQTSADKGDRFCICIPQRGSLSASAAGKAALSAPPWFPLTS
ncbi:MAG: hypothetical protein ACFB4I_05545 [Cyanophyceae cyanobacterium]